MSRAHPRREASTNGDPLVPDVREGMDPRMRRRVSRAGDSRPRDHGGGVGQALVVLGRDGTILAEYGLDQWILESEIHGEAKGSVAAVFTTEDAGDVPEALSRTFADVADGSAPSLTVRPAVGSCDRALRLALYRFDETRCIGVLSERRPPTESVGPGPSVPLLQAWSGLRDGMVLASTGTRTRGPQILAMNEAFRTLFGLTEEEAEGRDLVPLLAGDDEGDVLREVRSMVREGGGTMTSLRVVDTPSGDPRLVEWELAPIRDTEGRVLSLIGVLGEPRSSTVSRSIRSLDSEGMAEASSRIHFLRRVERCLERVRQSPSQGFAILGLEVEEDSVVRQRLGEAVGEAVLEAFAWRVQRALRPEDLVARIGPHRLGVLLDGFSSAGGVGVVIDRIEEATETPFTFAGENLWLPGVRTSGLAYTGEHLPESAREVLAGLD